MKYLSFRIANEKYAVPVNDVIESIPYSFITKVPNKPNYILGVMNLRGKIIPVFDTRLRMGMPSLREERRKLVEMLKQREKEHIEWLEVLEHEVRYNKPITVQRDPSKCNFGKWYGEYMKRMNTQSENSRSIDNLLYGVLKKFDEPHKKIHEIADRVDRYIKEDRTEDAKRVIKQTKDNVMAEMLSLFKELFRNIEDQETRDVVIIVDYEDDMYGMTVDAVDSTVDIEQLQESNVESDLVDSVGIVNKQTIQIFKFEAFMYEQQLALVG
ncbi:MAG TPA: hypothetical protein DEQ34_11545 [Balneolaceae bacterium]|nr:hypothetical protein [Balneolaceae bacterium]|tara:strand:+ start:53798 stop:54604 length:807 start_codon:yes stop_codon:yes gene_type:complete